MVRLETCLSLQLSDQSRARGDRGRGRKQHHARIGQFDVCFRIDCHGNLDVPLEAGLKCSGRPCRHQTA